MNLNYYKVLINNKIDFQRANYRELHKRYI